ncbi:hypothetical protein FRX31_006885, partial [Thalictrum thalictroides]
MPPLSSWNGSFFFHKWDPTAGSVELAVEEKMVRLFFYGVPLHLRNQQVVHSMAAYCGWVLDLDDGSISSPSQQCSARVKVRNLDKIPRCIQVEERGYFFTVWVEIDFQNLFGNTKKDVVALAARAPQAYQIRPPVLKVGLSNEMGTLPQVGLHSNSLAHSLSGPPGFIGPNAVMERVQAPAFIPPVQRSQDSNSQGLIEPLSTGSVSRVVGSPMGQECLSPFNHVNHFEGLRLVEPSQELEVEVSVNIEVLGEDVEPLIPLSQEADNVMEGSQQQRR